MVRLGRRGELRLTRQPMPGEYLLVIDDSPTVQKVVERALTEAGHRVLAAADGESALALMREAARRSRADPARRPHPRARRRRFLPPADRPAGVGPGPRRRDDRARTGGRSGRALRQSVQRRRHDRQAVLAGRAAGGGRARGSPAGFARSNRDVICRRRSALAVGRTRRQRRRRGPRVRRRGSAAGRQSGGDLAEPDHRAFGRPAAHRDAARPQHRLWRPHRDLSFRRGGSTSPRRWAWPRSSSSAGSPSRPATSRPRRSPACSRNAPGPRFRRRCSAPISWPAGSSRRRR